MNLLKRILMTVILAAALVGSAMAHDPNLSGIRIILWPNDSVINVTTHISRLKSVQGGVNEKSADTAIRRLLKVKFDGKDYVPDSAIVNFDEANDLVTWQAPVDGSPGSVEVTSRLFPDSADSKTVVSIVKGGQSATEVILDAANPSYSTAQKKQSALEIAGKYVVLGVEHILSGLDHVLFVLGLILLGGNLKSLIKTVTAFTIAHSITLTLAVTKILQPSPRFVEPLIALSIVAIAFENLRPRKPVEEGQKTADYRPYVAFGFGLLHGFGFAGALGEIGLQGGELANALLSFNIGVELGQACIILAAAPLIAWALKAKPEVWKKAAAVCSGGIAVVGGYWFVTRLLGLG